MHAVVSIKQVPDTAEHRLRERRHHYAQGHAADRLAGQPHRLLAALPGEAISETPSGSGGALAADIHDGGDDNGQQKLHEHDPQAAEPGDEPTRHPAGVGRRTRDQRLEAAGGSTLPELRGFFTE